MLYRLAEIKESVRLLMNQNRHDTGLGLEGDTETLDLDQIIEDCVCKGVRRTHLKAPVYRLEEGHWFGDDVYWTDETSGYVLLPDDFLRLVAFRMSDWRRACFNAIEPGSSDYAMQSSPYAGIRGNIDRPVCAVVNRAEGKALEFYSCVGNKAHVSRAVYIPEPKVEGGAIDISERCYPTALHAIAADASRILGETQRADMLEQTFETLLS